MADLDQLKRQTKPCARWCSDQAERYLSLAKCAYELSAAR